MKPSSQERSNIQDEAPARYQEQERQIDALSEELASLRQTIDAIQRERFTAKNYWWKGEQPPVWSNWVLALIAAVGGFYAFRTFHNAAEQSRLMGKTMVLANRPRITVRTFVVPQLELLHRDAPMKNVRAITNTFTGYFHAVNSGGALATIEKGYAGFLITATQDGLPMKPPYDVGDPTPFNIALGPGMSERMDLRPTQITNDVLVDVFLNKKRIYLVGWLEYIDTLKNTRQTAFCRVLSTDKPRRFVKVDDPDYEYAD